MAARYLKLAIAGIAIVLIVVLAIAAGAFVYSVLLPPVWSEQLPYKNSTGQYQSITVYRNATDTSYTGVLDFIASEKTGIEAAIAADTKERPVEYAVQIHDRAEAQGINCSVLATEISNGYPDHVFIAFHTIDQGMLYVDPTAKNVSYQDYPGIDFDRLIPMRDVWVQEASFLDGNGSEVYVTVYRNSTPVSYDDLLEFLADDHTEDAAYVDPTYTCANFATTLFNRAQSEGIKCGLVSVTFDGQPIGHAFNVFPTTDNGVVYIDDTGLIVSQKASNMARYQTDAVIYLEEGKPLGKLNLSQVGGQLDYSFYEEKKKMIDDFLAQYARYEADVFVHNQAVSRYEAEVEEYTATVNQFNEENSIKYNQYLNNVITYEAYLDWYNRDPLDAWKDRLDSERIRLNSELGPLNQRLATLMSSEGRNWAVYSYWQPPDGMVNTIEYLW